MLQLSGMYEGTASRWFNDAQLHGVLMRWCAEQAGLRTSAGSFTVVQAGLWGRAAMLHWHAGLAAMTCARAILHSPAAPGRRALQLQSQSGAGA